jgi:hypothetical protein
MHMQADDSGCQVKVICCREASSSELATVLESNMYQHCYVIQFKTCLQADDSGCQVKVVRGREASPSELATVLESQQEYNERRDGPHSTMQTVSQIIT